ncbi:exodeoxyribonuclease VII small subunit [Pseudohalioglobus lutimaris]|uniref:Exodeoxyribonuclease 7 small subunit n=1 Tax=Pseudohalioglobus lutimaris TaxID=1737061 RepID=A0A2N5X2H8_9GAMM|nr:exodeoxyribonuclease VII small subunit [Pseudohalioglobus lutimaris]PLW68696.1 exodeoxyribonuclease VII small subunit [Pseudohalioglobus lutimaris]
MSKKKQTPDFATTLAELETLTSRMEGDNLSLEESLRDFETGVQLIRDAQRALLEAQQKVQQLLDENTDPDAPEQQGDEESV